ncbi:MAG: pyruvate kinase alpha/beta domain-containing protein [Candidatus Helarchaeota archaeon]
MEEKIFYFEKPGPKNTEKVLEIVQDVAKSRGIDQIVFATTTGATGAKIAEKYPKDEFKLIAVTHANGFLKDIPQELTDENRKIMNDFGIEIFTGVHALSGIGRSFRGGLSPPMWTTADIIGKIFRSILGDGFKVCLEISLMAADAGLIAMDKDVICIGGKGRGSDTALILKPAYTRTFFDLSIKEIICKPKG